MYNLRIRRNTDLSRFNCNLDEIDAKVNAYYVKTGYSADKPRDAMKTTMPYPNAGLLIIIVNMVAKETDQSV